LQFLDICVGIEAHGFFYNLFLYKKVVRYIAPYALNSHQ
jgi:hypothetical protein